MAYWLHHLEFSPHATCIIVVFIINSAFKNLITCFPFRLCHVLCRLSIDYVFYVLYSAIKSLSLAPD